MTARMLMFFALVTGCASEVDDLTTEVAPDAEPDGDFEVELETTVGPVVIEFLVDWAPIGTDRVRELVDVGFYDDTRFFRVLPGFVVQFGLSGDPAANAEWRVRTIADDPVLASNVRGTVSFASSGEGTRTTQLFINYADNSRLDDLGFSPIGRVIEGMENVDLINAEHREEPDQLEIIYRGNAYLDSAYPELDQIITATIR